MSVIVSRISSVAISIEAAICAPHRYEGYSRRLALSFRHSQLTIFAHLPLSIVWMVAPQPTAGINNCLSPGSKSP
jgi:hypothetical protein